MQGPEMMVIQNFYYPKAADAAQASGEQRARRHGCTAMALSHVPFPAVVSVLTPLLPVFHTAPFPGGREASRLQGQLQEMSVISKSLSVSAAHRGLIILRAYRHAVAKTQVHQSFVTCRQLRMQTASTTGFSGRTVHFLIFKWKE